MGSLPLRKSPSAMNETLSASGVPVALADCRTCADPCDQGHSDYPRGFSVDLNSEMLGSVKPYRRQIVISTGKSDWDREVTETSGSLAFHIAQSRPAEPARAKLEKRPEQKQLPPIPGVFSSRDATRLSILNGSHKTISHDDEHETVLVLPDYTMVTGVPRTAEGAREMWATDLNSQSAPRPRGVPSTFQTWVIPYACVILLCSHKRRDTRCAIAAPRLESAFVHSLSSQGWTVETQLEHPVEPPLEDLPEVDLERHVSETLKEVGSAKKALILLSSHIGGHKYAGNCIIYTPQGSSVWYGRVTTHNVDAIVRHTIIGGLVLGPLLRGGLDLSRPGCETLHDW